MSARLHLRKRCVGSAIQCEIERLEIRRLFAIFGSSDVQIVRALDLPEGTSISYSGDASAVRPTTNVTTGGLLGLPSGVDNDFLMLSTGVAAQITGANSAGNQGTDLGDSGAAGDAASLSFSLSVPSSSKPQKLKFDFIFLSEEYKEYVGSSFNDIFTATVNGTNIALDQLGNVVSVNNVLFDGLLSTSGTMFDGRTPLLSATYPIPEGTSTLNVVFSISDVGDGVYDSAVLLDNVRFETAQTFWLDFGASTVVNFVGPLTSFHLSPFFASTLNSTEATADIEDQVVTQVQSLFSAYDTVITKTKPADGDFMTVSVSGNSNDSKITVYNPIEIFKLGTAEPTFRQWRIVHERTPGSLMGQAQALDVGNLNRSDKVIIFAGEFPLLYNLDTATETLIKRLAVTIAHEMGHNLGLRHIDDNESGEIMKHRSPRITTAVFNNQLYNLAEKDWADKSTQQNSDAYLRAVLGTPGGGSGVAPAGTLKGLDRNFLVDFTGYNLADATIAISDDENTVDSTESHGGAPVVMEFANLNGPKVIPVPVGMLKPRIFIAGSSKKGGPIDVFSGTATSGNLADGSQYVPLADATGTPLAIPLAKGSPGGLKQLKPVPVSTSALSIPPLTRNRGTFTDSDGDLYTVALSGPGTVAVAQDDTDGDGAGPISQIVRADTTAKSALSISVRKAKTGDGFVGLAQLSGKGPLKAIVAPRSELSGSIDLTDQFLGAVVLRGMSAGAEITAGGTATQVSSLVTVGAIGDGANINFGSKLNLLRAAQIGSGSIVAPAIGALVTTGAGGLEGDFNANISLTAGTPTNLLLKAMVIRGDVGDVTINSSAGTIGAIRAASMGAANISAITLGSLVTTVGNFAGRLTLSGLVSTRPTLNAVVVKGIADNAQIDITTGKLGTIKAGSFSNVRITAPTLNALVSRGDVTQSQITLAGVSDQVSLGAAVVAGTLDRSTIVVREGIVKSVVAGAINSSGLFVGINAVSAPPTSASELISATALLRSLIVRKIRGQTHHFVDSRVVASNIGSIVTGVLDTQTGSPFISSDNLATLVLTQLNTTTNRTSTQVYKKLDEPGESLAIDQMKVAIV